ncbi:hypothetical protein [Photobacterium phosphoreum]|uniref:hypothetical protein n=1 Tax=Photobacterium phosphoreum TaxID=659 RepID=UPI0011B1D766|nr:hypothetical protein [Photobacterium phosphoreum]
MKRYIVCLLFSSSVMAFDPSDTNRDGRIDFDEAVANPAVPSIPIDPNHTQAMQNQRWELYNRLPESGNNEGDLEAQTSTNGYVLLNKSQGLIKQWGRISLPGNALGQHRVSFSKHMSSVFAITVSSSDPYTSSSCRGCSIETGARVKSYNSSGFDITNGYIGDSKGGVFAVTLYWEATGKL